MSKDMDREHWSSILSFRPRGEELIENMGYGHWSNILVRGFPADESAEVRIPVDVRRMRAGMVVVASRIAGLMAALAPIDPDNPEADPLADESPSELGRLLDHVHRVRKALEAQEDRLIRLMYAQGASLRTIALHLGVSATTVSNRLGRIYAAEDEDSKD